MSEYKIEFGNLEHAHQVYNNFTSLTKSVHITMR